MTQHPDIVTRETLGKSIQERRLEMVTITAPLLAGTDGTTAGESVTDKQGREVKRRTVLVMAR